MSLLLLLLTTTTAAALASDLVPYCPPGRLLLWPAPPPPPLQTLLKVSSAADSNNSLSSLTGGADRTNEDRRPVVIAVNFVELCGGRSSCPSLLTLAGPIHFCSPTTCSPIPRRDSQAGWRVFGARATVSLRDFLPLLRARSSERNSFQTTRSECSRALALAAGEQMAPLGSARN